MTWVALVVVGFCTLAGAQATAPTTAPAVVVPVDTKSPRGSLKVMAAAMAAGDAAQLRQILFAGSPAEEKMRGAVADFSAAIVKLRKAAETSFSKAEAAELTGDMEGALADNNRRVDSASESINGDSATVQISDPGQMAPAIIRLKKVESAWQIVMEENGQPVSQDELAYKADTVTLQAKVLSESAEELAQGKNQTIDQLKQSIQAKTMAAVMRKQGIKAPSSQPTTLPATLPAGK